MDMLCSFVMSLLDELFITFLTWGMFSTYPWSCRFLSCWLFSFRSLSRLYIICAAILATADFAFGPHIMSFKMLDG